ncbi:Y-family DNA polymerase [[Mycoplasma] mobile]|uniref:DNA-damage repair protein n=1 Tax=Mycoplasma mobile (strain ATCC 43663 / 163K / NCTC 11711) TaxID=267748 RepID=Q6KI15_MYCM1|nr:DNA polymerase IV [[Mycoplasma] mobile]AAT27761.1 DNA-damage repair protein [Mycoplasma mobile 163K]
MKKEKTIFHIDADSFFVNSIITIRPELKGKEVAVSSTKSSSIVSSLSYEAKQKGAKVPMQMREVRKYCPNIITVLPNFKLFSIISNKIFDYLAKNFTKKLEIASIDECYLDVTDILHNYENKYNLARKMQEGVYKYTKIPISIGISHNKFLAKMASPLAKPNGIAHLDKNNFKEILFPMKISKFYGIGKSSIEKLNSIDVNFIKDLLDESKEASFKRIFKNRWIDIKNNLNGNGSIELDLEHNDVKEMGKEKTFFEQSIDDRNIILKELEKLSEIVSHNAKQRFNAGYVIKVKIKYYNLSVVSMQVSLPFAINDADEIFKNAISLFDKLWDEKAIKLIGIKLGKLVNLFEEKTQISLFEEKIMNNSKIDNLINDFNTNFNSRLIYKASNFPKKESIKKIQTRFLESDMHKK